MRMRYLKLLARLLATGLWLLGFAATAKSDEQFISLLSYRVGPYGQVGQSVFGGWIDYMQWVNSRGGINGVRIAWEECETEYNVAKGIECYERLKRSSATRGSMIHPLSTELSYALLERSAADRLPLVMIGYGRTDAVDGRYFPYAFPLVASYPMQASAMLGFIARRGSGTGLAAPAMDAAGASVPAGDLRGRRIAFVHHDSTFGREPLEILKAEAAQQGFDLLVFPVPEPGIEQTALWRQVKAARPDHVIFWSWGAMTAAGLQAAQKIGFPVDRIVGVWWAGAEEDVATAGLAAKGYMAANFGVTGKDLPLVQEILRTLYARGKGNMKDVGRVGSVLYTRGLLHGLITVEAIRTAQQRFGKRPLTGEEIRWGLEHLRIDQKRLRELGAEGLMPDMMTSCADHEGSGKVMFQQWDGKRWTPISDYVEGNRVLARALLAKSVDRYAAERKLTPRDCSAEDEAGSGTGRER